MPMSRNSRQRGSALLAVLWLSAALAAIAFSLANTVRGETERTSTSVDGLRSYYLATAAVDRTLNYMYWANISPDKKFYRPNDTVLRMSFPTGEAAVEVIPETSKMNINDCRPEDLFRLLMALGVEQNAAKMLVDAIVDWRTPSREGQFDAFYLSQDSSFRARHASLEEIEELLLVKGMTPALFYGTYDPVPEGTEESVRLVPRGALRDCVSVYGATDQFDVNTAHPAVLAAAGVPPDLIAMLVARRREAPLTAEGLRNLAQGGGPWMVRLRVGGNSMFTLRATARLRQQDGKLSDLRRSVGALVKLQPKKTNASYHILRWYDSLWSTAPPLF